MTLGVWQSVKVGDIFWNLSRTGVRSREVHCIVPQSGFWPLGVELQEIVPLEAEFSERWPINAHW
jgi:hypothetical protein